VAGDTPMASAVSSILRPQKYQLDDLALSWIKFGESVQSVIERYHIGCFPISQRRCLVQRSPASSPSLRSRVASRVLWYSPHRQATAKCAILNAHRLVINQFRYASLTSADVCSV
jgi:hypothetical protein